jgi:dTDP-4-dehydrorhamnose reductase
MKILLLGANGQVGHALRQGLTPLGDVIPATRSGSLEDGSPCEKADLDERDFAQPLLDRLAPDVVINAAAYTAVDRAEDEPEPAFRANAHAPGELALACLKRDTLLVHYSTDYVFDGSGTRPYREDDPTAPLGVYGASKLAGEQAIQASGCRHMIFRTAWVYGDYGHNFMRTMLRLAPQRNELGVVADQFGAPTPAVLIAQATGRALGSGHDSSGLWHLTSSGLTSWHGFAQAIFEQARSRGILQRVPHVAPLRSEEYPTRARRPAYSCLDNSAFVRTFGMALPDWREALSEVPATLPG